MRGSLHFERVNRIALPAIPRWATRCSPFSQPQGGVAHRSRRLRGGLRRPRNPGAGLPEAPANAWPPRRRPAHPRAAHPLRDRGRFWPGSGSGFCHPEGRHRLFGFAQLGTQFRFSGLSPGGGGGHGPAGSGWNSFRNPPAPQHSLESTKPEEAHRPSHLGRVWQDFTGAARERREAVFFPGKDRPLRTAIGR